MSARRLSFCISSATSTASRRTSRSERTSASGRTTSTAGGAAIGGRGSIAALERFGLGGLADIPAGYLSAGQKRRLALARLAVTTRPLWLLDEPTVSLDAAAVARLVAAIDEHVINGGIAIIATHAPLAIARFREIRLGPAEAAA